MKLTKESWIILIIGLLDLTSTLFWINNSGAKEANPIFNYYLAMGPVWFIAAKFTCLLCPILLFEFARRTNPKFAVSGARVAIAGYLILYAVGVANLNAGSGQFRKSQPSAMMGTLGEAWGEGHILVADHTFRMPMNSTDSYPMEGLR